MTHKCQLCSQHSEHNCSAFGLEEALNPLSLPTPADSVKLNLHEGTLKIIACKHMAVLLLL